MHRRLRICLTAALCTPMLLGAGCSDRLVVDAMNPSPDKTTVRFELTEPLLAGVPWPNDSLCSLRNGNETPCQPNIATTGLHAVVADWVSVINETKGWSPTATISIPFHRGEKALSGPAIDLESLLAAQRDDDIANDAIYVIDLETGRPVQLNFGKALTSFILQQTIALDLADPQKDAASLLVETEDERYDLASNRFDSARTSDGTTAGAPVYRTSWDRDADGVLDVPAYERGRQCQPLLDHEATSIAKQARCQADYLVGVYDPGADKLRVTPRAPLREGARYAVLLTNRLLDNSDPRRPIASPFETPYHPAERAIARRVEAILSDPKLAPYYGDIAGSGLKNAPFFFTFTTSAPTTNLAELSDKLRHDERTVTVIEDSETRLHLDCSGGRPRDTVIALLAALYHLSPGEREAVSQALASISAIRIGRFTHPAYLTRLGTRIRTELTPGDETVSVPYVVTVPSGHEFDSPLSAVLASHDVGNSRIDGLRWAGHLARFGLSAVLFDRVLSQTKLDTSKTDELRALAKTQCATTLLEGLLETRSDADYADFYDGPLSIDLVSTRDIWQTSAVEMMAFAQALSSAPTAASPSAARPLAIRGLLGQGEGGAIVGLAATLPGAPHTIAVVDPVTSPHRAWARGTDWGSKTDNTLSLFGPRIFGIPAGELGPEQTACLSTQSSLRLATPSSGPSGKEFGCIPGTIGENPAAPFGGTVIATNVSTGDRRCVGMTEKGEFSLGIATNRANNLTVRVLENIDALPRFGRNDDCAAISDASINSFEFTIEGYAKDARPFEHSQTISRGLGLERQSVEFRTHIDFAEAAFAAANATTFFSHLGQQAPGSGATGTLILVSPGNPRVSPDEGLAVAVATGLVPNLPDEALSRSPDEALSTTPTLLVSPPASVSHPHPLNYKTAELAVAVGHVAEGAPRLLRHDPEPNECHANRQTPDEAVGLCHPPCDSSADCPTDTVCSEEHICETAIPSRANCAQSLFDSDAIPGALSGTNTNTAPFPLRLGRYSGKPATKQAYELWEPRAMTSTGSHPDWPFAALSLPLGHPLGSHGILTDDICERFRLGTYVPHLLGVFIASKGRTFPPVMSFDDASCLSQSDATTACPFIPSSLR